MDKFKKLKIGVLALQGDFERHQHQLFSLGIDVTLVKLPVDLENINGLIIPGGESTTMDKLIDCFALRQPLTDFVKQKPVWGTCAGMIMLAKNIKDNQSHVKPLGAMDIDVVRMGYGRQVFSFEEKLKANLNGKEAGIKASFIRAPMITRLGEQVKVLAVYEGKPVLVEENKVIASSFHTELDDDITLLTYFLEKFLLS